MEAEHKRGVRQFILNNLGQLDQEDYDAWLEGDFDLTPLLEPVLRAMKQHRDLILAELHQISPAEILDRWMMEHPELDMGDKDRALVRVGRELELMKNVLRTV